MGDLVLLPTVVRLNAWTVDRRLITHVGFRDHVHLFTTDGTQVGHVVEVVPGADGWIGVIAEVDISAIADLYPEIDLVDCTVHWSADGAKMTGVVAAITMGATPAWVGMQPPRLAGSGPTEIVIGDGAGPLIEARRILRAWNDDPAAVPVPYRDRVAAMQIVMTAVDWGVERIERLTAAADVLREAVERWSDEVAE
jgi:hypothetical protein